MSSIWSLLVLHMWWLMILKINSGCCYLNSVGPKEILETMQQLKLIDYTCGVLHPAGYANDISYVRCRFWAIDIG